MKCPKKGCGGSMYRFYPKHLVTACHRTLTDVVWEFGERDWRQIGLLCDRCGYMEFYTEDPPRVLAQRGCFEDTEPGGRAAPGAKPRDRA